MKNILLLICGTLLLGSCTPTVYMGEKGTPAPPPYIKTEAKTVTDIKNFQRKGQKLVADHVSYQFKNIIAFSNGGNEYMKVRGSHFAVKYMAGDINVYIETKIGPSASYSGSSSSPVGWSPSSNKLFLQKAPSDKLLPYSYRSVKFLIPPKDPAYKYITAYNKRKHNSRILKLAGLGAMAAAITLLAVTENDYGKTPAAAIATGVTGIVGGFTAVIWGFNLQRSNDNNLRRAVGTHNGTYGR